jgi:hypothetical protein
MTKKVAGLQFQSAEMTGREKGHNFSPKFSWNFRPEKSEIFKQLRARTVLKNFDFLATAFCDFNGPGCGLFPYIGGREKVHQNRPW